MKSIFKYQIRYFLKLYVILCCFLVADSLNASKSSSPSALPTCLHQQSSLLLQFKQEFPLKEPEDYSDDDGSPKMETWEAEKDCCSWDGVQCDTTGHVIGLDLSNSSLQGPLHSNSSLFRLTHLRRLNLSSNDFNFSTISSGFGHLLRLTHLDLSESMFSGKISPEISRLTSLVSLDLSCTNYADDNPLSLEKVAARRLIRNGTNLRVLHLDGVDLSSLEAESFANLSSLECLSLRQCNLSGVFPTNIFRLPTIQSIDVSFNDQLTGFVPEFYRGSRLKSLVLSSTKFSGTLLDSIGNLKSLNVLDLNSCNFSGTIPTSIGNLFQVTYLDLSSNNFNGELPTSLGSLTKLNFLYLQKNSFSGRIPSLLGNLTRLTELLLSNNKFSGEFPISLANLTQLDLLSLSSNQLTGPIPHDTSIISNSMVLSMLDLSHNSFNGTIPPSLFRIPSLSFLHLENNQLTGPLIIKNVSSSQLSYLNLRWNNLNGQLPRSISELTSLTELNLDSNNLSGITDFGIFSNLSSLATLVLSYNNLTITNTSKFAPSTSFTSLRLASCNIGELPKFLESQNELWELDISDNKIEGKIPKWFLRTGTEFLSTLLLSSNFITGWEEEPSVLPWKGLDLLDLRHNNIQGSLVVPPSSMRYFFISDNTLTGNIDPSFCELHGLKVLDVSYNHLSGEIPRCLGLNSSLLMLNLQTNDFRGDIPPTCEEGSVLKTLDLSHNRLQGKVPKSLIQCKELEVLNIGHNEISDQFPFWIQRLPMLKVLVLHSNKFDGPIWHPQKFFSFEKLQIIDLSFNNFSGDLPSDYFRNWSAINTEIPNVNKSKLRYMGDTDKYYQDSMTLLIHKGVIMELMRILTTLMSIDLSCNCFHGAIPSSVGDLKSLIVLNLSRNNFDGPIPKSLGRLSEIESLGLSKNRLSGDHTLSVPWKSLQFLDLRSNMLQGPLVVPPLSTEYFFVSENKLTEGIHPLFCNLSNLMVLDLSNNLLNGTIPQCLGNFSNSLLVLSMKGNDFHGTIPQTFLNGSSLQTLDLSHNQLRGKIPQSLIHCRALEVLNLGHNKINDVFPLWLQNLPELQVLVLRSNEFHGPLWHSDQKLLGFLKLRILDLSFNKFNGNLSPEFFSNWSAINADIRASNKSELRYMKDDNGYYQDSVTVTDKGLEIDFVKILTIFTSIDLSNNNFHGEIPTSIGDLKSLIVLNLSSNNFEGLIPSSMGKLTELESLDLSNNSLSGRIPQELASLSFLECLNLSDNKLTGLIPQSRQFDTFLNSSFEGNSGLCGSSLSKKCQATNETPTPDHNQESDSENSFGWKAVAVGYGCGFLVGVIGGHLVFLKKPNWFIRIYGIKMQW